MEEVHHGRWACVGEVTKKSNFNFLYLLDLSLARSLARSKFQISVIDRNAILQSSAVNAVNHGFVKVHSFSLPYVCKQKRERQIDKTTVVSSLLSFVNSENA